MTRSRLRSIVEHLDDAICMANEEPTRSERPPARQVTETASEVPEVFQRARQEMKNLNEAFERIGRETAQFVFGKALDRMPSRVLALESSVGQIDQSLNEYTEHFKRLTKPLYESQNPTIYREDIERAALLFVVSEMSGRTYEQVLVLNENDQQLLIEKELGQLARDKKALDQFEDVLPSLIGAAKAVGRGVGSAATWAGNKIAAGGEYISKKSKEDTEEGVQAPTPARPAFALDESFVDKTRKLLREV